MYISVTLRTTPISRKGFRPVTGILVGSYCPQEAVSKVLKPQSTPRLGAGIAKSININGFSLSSRL